MSARTYINAECQIGQSMPCGADVVHLVAVYRVADNAWTQGARDGGVVPLCHYHASTPVTEWSR